MDETTEQIAEELDHSAVHGSMLTFWQRFSYSLGEMGVSLSPAIVVSWFIYFYTGRPVMGADPNTGEAIQTGTLFLVSPFAIGLLGLIGRLVDSVADPLVGFYSDKWHFKMGRRIPWVVFGTPFLILFSILLWFPPDGDGMGRTLFS
ncbi:MFS transporter, partial [bacterium]|nr:MFS transporter [bacterium]